MSRLPSRSRLPAWTSARAAHQEALQTYLERTRHLPVEQWERAVAPGKWSPAQISEHLRLTYTLVRRELEGGEGIRVRTPPWLRPLLRVRFLYPMLRSGVVPPGAFAPREVQPGAGPFPREATLRALEAAGAAFEDAVAQRWGSREHKVTHHVFGRLSLARGVRCVTIHLHHHTRQLPPAGQSPSLP